MRSNERGRALLARLVDKHAKYADAALYDESEIAEARALLAAPDGATVRADLVKRLRAEANGFRATAAELAAGLNAPVTLGALIDGLDDLAHRIEQGR